MNISGLFRAAFGHTNPSPVVRLVGFTGRFRGRRVACVAMETLDGKSKGIWIDGQDGAPKVVKAKLAAMRAAAGVQA